MIAKTLAAVLSSLFIMVSAQAEVTHWRVIKGAYYLQSADNTPDATTTNWGMFGIVETALAGDAASVVIEGGNISGSIAYELEGNEWELGADYHTKTALDAVFPAGNYSIILSGGTMGSVTQQFSIGADAYPNTPHLTGADYSDCLALEALEPFELNWNNAGSTTTVSLEINTGDELDEGDGIFSIYSNNYSAVELPWSLFEANSNYNGYIDFANAALQGGVGGFGIAGDVSFNKSLAFHIDTVSTAVASDDFTGGTNSSWVSFFSETGKGFSPTNDVLEFFSDSGPDGDSTAWIYETDALTYTQDWAVAVDISNLIDSSALSSGQEVYFSLVVASDGLNDLILIENYMESDYSELFTVVDENGVEEVLTASVQISEQQYALKISFDADTKILTTAYSFGGDYTMLTNISTVSWGLSDSDTFLTALSCGTANLPVAAGEVYADNFRIYDGGAISNHIELIDVEYIRGFETPGTDQDDYNEYSVEIETDHRVISVEFELPDGERIPITDVDEYGQILEWEFYVVDPISEPFDSTIDGDFLFTFGYQDGTFQSTWISFTKEDGLTPIPVITNQPLFTAIHVNAAASTATFEWDSYDANANHFALDLELGDDDFAEIGLYLDSVTDEIGAIEIVPQPLSTTQAVDVAMNSGTNRILFLNGWARTAYNDDGVPYIVSKVSESDYLVFIPAANDLDDDKMDDDWETEYFGGTNAVNGGAYDDFDMDGLLNIYEFISGANPTNGGSVFGVDQAEPVPEGFVVNWNSVEGRKYGVYWTDSLSDGFQTLVSDLPYPVNSFTDTLHTAEDGGFYYIDVQLDD